MPTFYMRDNKGAGEPFAHALIESGYTKLPIGAPESGLPDNIRELYRADFLLLDHDWNYHNNPEWNKAIKEIPTFIYPHTPYSWFLWDGILETKPVRCNFVVSHGARIGMELYGYSQPTEVVGFSLCDVKPFKPTTGTKLLFAPAHPVHDGKFPQPEGLKRVQRASKKIIENLHHFESVTVRYHGNMLQGTGLEYFKNTGVNFQNINVYTDTNIKQSALRAIAESDLVISESTFGYLAVASGKPTIFYGYDADKIPDSREGLAKHYHRYKHIFHFPLNFEAMSIEQILEIREAANGKIERWKSLNIGDNFQPEKFVRLLEEYL